MHMRIAGIVSLWLLMAPAAYAGMLYKCSSVKGEMTIQSDPCPTGSTEIWKRDSTPAAQPTLQQVVADSVHAKPATAAAPATAPANAVPAATGVATAPTPTPTPTPIAATVVPAPMPAPVAVAPAPAGPPPPPPAAVFPPPANQPSTIPLQWHDEPETPAGQPPVNTACESAKLFAHSVEEKIWLGLTQDQTQRLYGWVLDQCDNR